MTLPVRFSLLHSDLNDFLFASVGEEIPGKRLPGHPLRRGRLRPRRSPANCLIAEPSTAVMSAGARSSSQIGNQMNYLVPPIVMPALLLIGVLAYGMLRPPIILGHAVVPTAHSQAR